MTSRRAAVLCCALLAVLMCVSCSNRTANVNRRPQSGLTTAAAVGGVQQVTITAGDTLRFVPDTITVHPGQVKITLVDSGGAPHNFQLTDFPADFVPTVSGGTSASATFTAPAPGRYRFVCTIHEAEGQTGTLIVLPQ